MDIDPLLLSKYLQYLEYEVNYYYPGLDLEYEARLTNLDIVYKWADYHTQYQGEYDDTNTEANVYLRNTDLVTARMRCMDRYVVAMHEILHFVCDRYLGLTYPDGDVHNVANVFQHWAIITNQPMDLTVEGRLYTLIRRECQEE